MSVANSLTVTLGLALVLGLPMGCAQLRRADTVLPTPSNNVSWRMPEIQMAGLSNGMTIYVVEQPYVPLVSVHLLFRAGSAATPTSQAGLAELAYHVLLRGTDKTPTDLALRRLGIQPSVNVEYDGAEISFLSESNRLPQALELLGEMVQKPTLAEEDVAALKKLTIAQIEDAASSPRYKGTSLMLETLYGRGHPYGVFPLGRVDTVSRVTRQDVVRFHERYTGAKNVALVVCGRTSLVEAKAWAEKAFGTWQGGTSVVEKAPSPERHKRKGVLVVPVYGLPQTLILLGKLTIPLGHPDELALDYVYSSPSVWGGYELRERYGVTYGIGAGLSMYRSAGHMLTYGFVQANATGKSLRELLRGQDDSHDLAGASDESAYKNRSRMAMAEMLQFEDLPSAGKAVAQIFYNGFPTDYYPKKVDRLLDLRAGEIGPAARRYLGSDGLHIVLVGDPEVIRDQLRLSSLGPVSVIGE